MRTIVSSGYSSDSGLANHVDAGLCALLTKPYDLEDFRAVPAELKGTIGGRAKLLASLDRLGAFLGVRRGW